jgi:hypothetical protein
VLADEPTETRFKTGIEIMALIGLLHAAGNTMSS